MMDLRAFLKRTAHKSPTVISLRNRIFRIRDEKRHRFAKAFLLGRSARHQLAIGFRSAARGFAKAAYQSWVAARAFENQERLLLGRLKMLTAA